MKPSLALSLCLAGSTALLAMAACQDDATIDQEPILPGVGPIGMGGSGNVTAGMGGAGGSTGGTAGSGGSAGTGGSTGGTAGQGGTAGVGGATGGKGGATGGAGTGGGGAGGMGPVVMCPTETGASINVANLVPAAGTFDFCLRAAGSADLLGPIFKCGGGAAEGLSYKDVAKGVSVAPGTYDILAATNGDCTGTAYAMASGVMISTSHLVTVMGGPGGETPSVKVFTNDPPFKDGVNVLLRFVDALHGVGPVDVGLADMAGAGAMVDPAIFINISFGGISLPVAATALGTAIDANGYLQAPALGAAPSPVGAALTGTKAAIFAAGVVIDPADTNLTAIGVGTQGDPAFPLGALVCNDDSAKATGPLLSCVSVM